jgi:hypothetical protein
MVYNLYNFQEYEIHEIELVATFKLPVATCGEWRQGWKPLNWCKEGLRMKK